MVQKKFQKNNQNEMSYIIFHPEEYTDLPLLIYLHGAGERGNNMEHLYRHGVPKLIHEGKEINAIVLIPQCPAGFVWNNLVVQLKTLIDNVVTEYTVRPDRICITGSSMGGFGTWEMGLTYRNFFAVIAPISGGGMSWRCPGLKGTPVLAYHGELDSTVPVICSQQMVDAVNAHGGIAELTILPDKEHNNGIDYAYQNTDLIERILTYRRENFDYVPDVCEELYV